ncbi:hypothetical protein [Polaribacter vadi]|uniref:hypothetical protein n=1 Tax=Polaribacter vadi TaxID=1774273 RepID=UPI0030ED34CD
MIQNHIEKEFIGIIGNRPIYKIVRANSAKLPFKVTSRTLIIGDGLNAPLLIVKDALKAMYHYILEAPIFNFNGLDSPGYLGFTDKEILTYIVFNHDPKGHFIYHNYTQQHKSSLKQMCKSNLLEKPFSEMNVFDFNTWLHIHIGAFVWFYCKDITDFITFSSYDYFVENYLENVTMHNTAKNVIGIPENMDSLQGIEVEHKKKIRFSTFDSPDDEFFMNELIAGNHWDLDNVYDYFKERTN